MSTSSATAVGASLRFPAPPLGLSATAFELSPVEATGSLYTLRATDEEGLRLFLLDPAEYFPGYVERVCASVHTGLGTEPSNVGVLVVLNPGEVGERPTANLLAPVLVDLEGGVGVQTVLEGDDLPLRAPLVDAA